MVKIGQKFIKKAVTDCLRKEMVVSVRKRDGSLEKFSPEKIQKAVESAFADAHLKEGPEKVVKQVIDLIEKYFSKKLIPSTSDVQEILMDVLRVRKLDSVIRAYEHFQRTHKSVREFRTVMGVRNDLNMSPNSMKVLIRRYLLKNEEGAIIETPRRLFERVAKAIAGVDKLYDPKEVRKSEEVFFEMMADLDFLPNTPCLMNAGTDLGILSACFVLPVEDDVKSIFHTAEYQALIQQHGGGTGFSFSRLRPRGDIVKSTKGVASGPVSFMRVFDTVTEVMKQGGRRRGANMGILRVDHPDIRDFITVKNKGLLQNFNISVGVTDSFIEAVEKDEEYSLINPRNNKTVRRERAREIFDLICESAHKTGDPGLVFLDEINRRNPTSSLGLIESTNPCGEQPLHAFESCVLGSINLSKMVKNKKIDWERLKHVVRHGVHFLDNIIDAQKVPIPEIDQVTKANRRIGLGVMGFAEMLIQLEISYASQGALSCAEKIMKFISEEAVKKSQELGAQRGSFPNFEKSSWKTKKFKHMRNATVTTIAPTGTISIIAGCSSGIEPLFAVSFVREVMEGTRLLETNFFFEEMAKKRGFYSKELMVRISEVGSVQNVKDVPKDVKSLFMAALDIPFDWHVKMQAAFQKYTDNAVSKTVNLPSSAAVQDVKKAYLLAYKLKCKGITVFRYGSKEKQVLYVGQREDFPKGVDVEFAGGCPSKECMN